MKITLSDLANNKFYLFNRWRCDSGDSRCGMNLSFSGKTATLYPKDDMANRTPWQFEPVPGTNDQFYLFNRWECDSGDSRCGMNLSFSGRSATLYPKDDVANRTPWQLVPVPGTDDQFYLFNRWRCDSGDSRCDMNLSFSGKTATLYPKDDVANRTPWQLVPVDSAPKATHDLPVQVQKSAFYNLKNNDTGYFLHGDNIPSGGNARQYQEWDTPNPCQQWQLIPVSGNSYMLKNRDTGYVLHGDNIPSGGNARQHEEWGTPNPCQHWELTLVSGNSYLLKNKDTGHVLHGDNIPSGGNARQYQEWGTPNPCQHWELIVADRMDTPAAAPDSNQPAQMAMSFCVANSDNGSIWQYAGAPNQWVHIGDRAKSLTITDGQLVIVNSDNGSIWQYNGTPHQWTHIGDRAAKLASSGKRLVIVNSDNGSIWEYNGTPNQWTHIGERASELTLQGGHLVIVNADNGSIWQYNGSPHNWTHIGDRATKLATNGKRLVIINSDNGSIWQYNGTPHQWTHIGDRAAQIADSGNRLVIVNADNGSIWQYNGSPHQWTHIGDRAAQIAMNAERLAIINADNGSIWQYNGTPNQWTHIGDRAAQIAVNHLLTDPLHAQVQTLDVHIVPPIEPKEKEKIQTQAEELAKAVKVLSAPLSPPVAPVLATSMAKLIADGQMPQYQLYLRLKNAIQNNELLLSKAVLGDFGLIGEITAGIFDAFVTVQGPKVTFSAGTGGMVGAPGREIKEPDKDGNLSAPDDNAVKVSGEVDLLNITSVKLDTADFFIYKARPHCSFKFKFGNNVSLASLMPSVSIIPNLKLKEPTLIACTANTIYDQSLDSGINQGINVFGNIVLQGSGDRMLQFLGDFLLTKEIAIHGAIDTAKPIPTFLLEAAIQRNVTIVDGECFKLRYTRSDIALEMTGRPPEPSLKVSTDLVVTLNKGGEQTDLIFTGGLKGEAESITGYYTLNGTGRGVAGDLSGNVQNTTEWKEPFGIPGVVIRQMAAQIGFSYTTLVDNVGIHGNMKIGDVDGSISFLVDTNDADQFVLAGTTDHISIFEIMSAATPTTFLAYQALPDLITDTLEKVIDVSLEDVKVNIVPTACSIGGVHFRDEGFTIAGRLVMWGWAASAYVNVDTFDGITARGDMDPVDLLGGLFKIAGAQGEHHPTMRLRISPSTLPECYVSGRIELLGLSQEVKIVAEDGRLNFQLDTDLGNILHVGLRGSYGDMNFTADGAINFNLNATIPTPFGDIDLVDIGFNANTSLRVGRDHGFYASIGGSFHFWGVNITMPTLTIDVPASTFQDLYDAVISQIMAHGGDMFLSLFGTLGEWANAVKDGLITAGKAVATVAKEVFNATAEAAVEAYKTLEQGAGAIADGLADAYNMVSNDVANIMRGAGFPANEVAGALDNTFSLAGDGAASALRFAGYGLSEVGNGVEDAYNLTSDGVASAMKGAGYAVGEVGGFMKDTGRFSEGAVNDALRGAGYAADEVGDFMGDVFGGGWVPYVDIPYIDVPAPYVDIPYVDIPPPYWDVPYVDVPYIDLW